MADTLKISLKAARVNAGMTQDDVCKKMHITQATLRNWESGRVNIPFISLTALSNLYNMPVDNIFLEYRST